MIARACNGYADIIIIMQQKDIICIKLARPLSVYAQYPYIKG